MPFPSHFSAAINTQSPETVEKVEAVFAKYAGEDLTVETHPAYRELFGILRTPIRRRIEKANKQIKGAKKELGLVDHRGIVFLVNDNFRSAHPGLVMDLIRSILGEKDRDRKSVVWGKSGSVRVDRGGGRIIKKKK